MTTAPLPPPPSSEMPPTGVPSSAPTGPAARRLRRSGTDRMVGGVCGGLADCTGIDPVLWRVGFVGLTVAGGSGVLVYVFLWMLAPAEPLPADTGPSPVERIVQRLHGALSRAMASVRRDH